MKQAYRIILIELLRKHKTTQGKTYILSQQKQDKRIDPNKFSLLFRSWCKKSGIENITPHSTKHTYYTMALELGTDTKTTADQLGHKDTKMIKRVTLIDAPIPYNRKPLTALVINSAKCCPPEHKKMAYVASYAT